MELGPLRSHAQFVPPKALCGLKGPRLHPLTHWDQRGGQFPLVLINRVNASYRPGTFEACQQPHSSIRVSSGCLTCQSIRCVRASENHDRPHRSHRLCGSRSWNCNTGGHCSSDAPALRLQKILTMRPPPFAAPRASNGDRKTGPTQIHAYQRPRVFRTPGSS